MHISRMVVQIMRNQLHREELSPEQKIPGSGNAYLPSLSASLIFEKSIVDARLTALRAFCHASSGRDMYGLSIGSNLSRCADAVRFDALERPGSVNGSMIHKARSRMAYTVETYYCYSVEVVMDRL